MKRVILCILGYVLLMTLLSPVLAEENCKHENANILVSKVVVPSPAGHTLMEEKIGVCPDCHEKISEQKFGGFAGHILCMAESIHSQQESMHLWVFVCTECMYVTMLEEPCEAGENCNLYSAQVGVIPTVQLADSFSAWKEPEAKNDIISRFISNRSWLLDNQAE